MEIAGSVALVTGANRGTGHAFVAALLQRGAVKVYAAARDPAALAGAFDGDHRLVPIRVTCPA